MKTKRGRGARRRRSPTRSRRSLGIARRVALRGPAPCPISRIADRWRFQIELLADGAAPLQTLLAEARSRAILVPGELVAVDVDPVALM